MIVLWLAREGTESEEICLVEPVIQKVVNDYQYLIENKDITLEINMLYNKSVDVKEEVLYITDDMFAMDEFYALDIKEYFKASETKCLEIHLRLREKKESCDCFIVL